ncbi:1,4-alpha-glucan branching protein GlgB [Wenyingzhuangia sp. chi5]|uniref:1,4-alpha-glucan branching enzyme GlgB n=1 Tax=Wenyingzhuangia gilva TaxID=3057677 RepID=A0ABT8VNY5_9FLAO|nr:1,4-alpha-glucan branching protein GlgB [Wenyingzhuangia sp. chi5]MDO3693689.1 1,4-alpha-glucan branching protein GlgB [Wenyingzhuangia sp. chi5]
MNHVQVFSLFTDFDIYLFKSGKHFRLYEKFGAHPATVDGVNGMYFSVWAPTANRVSVVGDFNFWNDSEHVLNVRWDSSGIWEGFIPHVKVGEVYKYKIHSNNNGIVTEKCDPYGYHTEHPPKTASVTYDIEGYEWQDKDWMTYRKDKNDLDKPYAVYEVHFESWMKNVDENRPLSYWEASKKLVQYVKEMNFTHVEFMPIMEYPFDQSWGYQLTGYFAPSCRFGHPKEFMNLVDEFHKNDIGVILDWVPSHFPSDDHGLGFFDGSHLYEHPDRRRGYHKDWKSLIFNYGRNEVRSFLISNACFWLDKYHIDGLRVDAVASMLYLDYSREEGEWEPNKFGGNENLEAIEFLKDFNTEVYNSFPGVQTIAEESTAFSGVTRDVEHGGLGFGMKWMMGWMHDTLGYFKKDPIHRKYHHNEITFSMAYAFTERYMLPLSHDEVVYGKGSIIGRMPGDKWQKLANLRLLFGYMYSHPGGNLLFMGAEFGQENEWSYATSLDWHLLENPEHKAIQTYMKDLNQFLKETPALYEKGFSQEGFEWINHEDGEKSVLSYIRKGHEGKNDIIVLCNATPTVQENYLIGVHKKGKLKEIFNSDLKKYGGSGIKNSKQIEVSDKPWNWKDYSAEVTIPPLGIVIFQVK